MPPAPDEDDLPRPVFVIDKLLPEGGTMIVAASPKVGKSGIALNAAKAVATGEDFLGIFPVRQGRCVYVQTEIPAWAMAERLKLMGALCLLKTPFEQISVRLCDALVSTGMPKLSEACTTWSKRKP